MKTKKTKTKPRVERVRVVTETDCDPDFSHLGEYTDDLDLWNIVREKGEYFANLPKDYRTPERGREYRYFKPYAGGTEPGSKDYQEYGKQDFQRCEAYNRQEWCFVGIYAEARVSYEDGPKSRRLETLKSGGLWGIESDAGDYLKEVGEEQLADLKNHLARFGVSLRGFAALAKEALEKM